MKKNKGDVFGDVDQKLKEMELGGTPAMREIPGALPKRPFATAGRPIRRNGLGKQQLTVWLTPAQIVALKIAAAKEGVSNSALVERLLTGSGITPEAGKTGG